MPITYNASSTPYIIEIECENTKGDSWPAGRLVEVQPKHFHLLVFAVYPAGSVSVEQKILIRFRVWIGRYILCVVIEFGKQQTEKGKLIIILWGE